MTELYNDYPALVLLVLMYVFLALVKVTICLSHLPTASRVMAEHHPELSRGACAIVVGLSILTVIPFLVLYSLRTEGWKYFLAYSEAEVEQHMNAGFANRNV